MSRPEINLEIIRLEPWNGIDYETALAKQSQLNARAGTAGWILFCCPPTITIGNRGESSDILLTESELKRRGVKLVKTQRGGQVTYHGPGQIIGFPFGTLEAHVGDSRGVKKFICGLESKLQDWISPQLPTGSTVVRQEDNTGLWIKKEGSRLRKIVSIGMAFHRTGMNHGFALNVLPMDDGFSAINACGEKDAQPGSLLEIENEDARFQTEKISDDLSAFLAKC